MTIKVNPEDQAAREARVAEISRLDDEQNAAKDRTSDKAEELNRKTIANERLLQRIFDMVEESARKEYMFVSESMPTSGPLPIYLYPIIDLGKDFTQTQYQDISSRTITLKTKKGSKAKRIEIEWYVATYEAKETPVSRRNIYLDNLGNEFVVQLLLSSLLLGVGHEESERVTENHEEEIKNSFLRNLRRKPPTKRIVQNHRTVEYYSVGQRGENIIFFEPSFDIPSKNK